jgi:3-oxoacyl-[acyl-carrier-protein] synthase III
MSQLLPVGIYGIEYFLPEKVLTSEQIAAASGLDRNIMESKLGIRSLHIASETECASDLAFAASEKLLAETGFPRSDIDGIVLCTQNPDYKLPTTACLLQNRLGLKKSCLAFDINQGCSGYPYGLAVGASLMNAGVSRNLLLVMAETYSKVVSYKDKTVCGLFGDAAAATLLRRTTNGYGILSLHFGTDGSGYDRLIVKAGGARHPSTDETRAVTQDAGGNFRSLENIQMYGRDIFEFMMREVPGSVYAALEKAGVGKQDVKLFVFHQANKYMLEFLFRKMGLPAEKTIVCMEEVGNTVSASIPIALKCALQQKRVDSGDILVLCGFGVGLSWATAVLRWCPADHWADG